MSFVAHHASHDEARGARSARERGRVARRAAAARHTDVHVDQHLADAVGRGRVNRRFGVDGHGHACAAFGHRAQTGRVDGLVREQEVGAQARTGHADDLRGRRAREVLVSVRGLLARERGALVCLDVRA